MKDLLVRNSYKRDLKRITKRGYDLDRLYEIVDLLRASELLSEIYRDHSLKGEWIAFRECHIGPDWLLIYQVTDDEVLLARTGSHADLFE